MRCLSGVSETWWGEVGDFLLARTQTHSPPDVKPAGALQPAALAFVSYGFVLVRVRGRSTPRLLYTGAFERVLFMFVAGLAHCYGESNYLT